MSRTRLIVAGSMTLRAALLATLANAEVHVIKQANEYPPATHKGPGKNKAQWKQETHGRKLK